MREEVWKEIPGYSGLYFASTLGRIKRIQYQHPKRSKHTKEYFLRTVPEKILAGSKVSKKGYARVNLNDKVHFVHRIVAEVFLGPAGGLQVNHKDGNKTNNAVENLEYVTNQQNRNHAVRHNLHPNRSNGFCKVSMSECVAIREMYNAGKLFQWEIANMYGVCQQTISQIIKVRKSDVQT